MAKAPARSLAARRPPYRALARPLTAAERTRLSRHLARLVDWQRNLRAWPTLDDAPDATPFVSLYAGPRLVGCFGSDEGAPGERIARAFLRAIADARQHALAPAEREQVTAQVSFVVALERVQLARAPETIEAGTHGVASRTAILLPDVARDNGWNASQLLEALARKQGSALDDEIWRFRTERVTSQRATASDSRTLALGWLERLVGADGSITFAIDPRRRTREQVGVMCHGRAAIVVQALALHRGRRPAVRRARARLLADIRAALRGRPIAGWPQHRAVVVGTLALACRAGLPLAAELRALVASTPELARTPWHAAQAIAVLGRDANPSLWRACVRDSRARALGALDRARGRGAR